MKNARTSTHGSSGSAVPIPLLATALALVVVYSVSGAALATHVDPTLVIDNRSCAQLGAYEREFKIEPVISDTHSDPESGFVVEISVRSTADGPTFDFDANLPVDAVFVKGGPGGNLYVYDQPETSDTGLHAPINDGNETYYGLSHISFCFGEAPAGTPSPEPTAEATPEPTPEPTAEPTPEATPEPTAEPTLEATPEPTAEPSLAPTPPDTAVAPAPETPSSGRTAETALVLLFIGSLAGALLLVRPLRRRKDRNA